MGTWRHPSGIPFVLADPQPLQSGLIGVGGSELLSQDPAMPHHHPAEVPWPTATVASNSDYCVLGVKPGELLASLMNS